MTSRIEGTKAWSRAGFGRNHRIGEWNNQSIRSTHNFLGLHSKTYGNINCSSGHFKAYQTMYVKNTQKSFWIGAETEATFRMSSKMRSIFSFIMILDVRLHLACGTEFERPFTHPLPCALSRCIKPSGRGSNATSGGVSGRKNKKGERETRKTISMKRKCACQISGHFLSPHSVTASNLDNYPRVGSQVRLSFLIYQIDRQTSGIFAQFQSASKLGR